MAAQQQQDAPMEADEVRQPLNEEVRRLQLRLEQLGDTLRVAEQRRLTEEGAYNQTERLRQLAEGREGEQRLVFCL